MKYLKKFESRIIDTTDKTSLEEEREYLSDLFIEYSDKWGMQEALDDDVKKAVLHGNYRVYLNVDIITRPLWFIVNSWRLSKTHMLVIFFPQGYGDCGIYGTGATNTTNRYLSQDFIQDMRKYQYRITSMGYKTELDFTGGNLRFDIHIK